MTGACCQACKLGKTCKGKKKNETHFNATKRNAMNFSWSVYGSPKRGRYHDNCYDYAFGLNNEKATNKNVPGNMSGNRAWGLDFTSCKGIAKRVLEDYKGLAYKCKTGSQPCRRGYYKVMNFVAPQGGDFHWYRQTNFIRYKIRANDTITGLAKFFRVSPVTIRTAVLKAHRPRGAFDGRISNTNLPVLNALDRQGRGRLPAGKVIEFPVKLWSHKQGWATGPVIVDASGKTIADPRRANRKYPGLNYSKFCSAYCVKVGAGKMALARSQRAKPRVTGYQFPGILRL